MGFTSNGCYYSSSENLAYKSYDNYIPSKVDGIYAEVIDSRSQEELKSRRAEQKSATWHSAQHPGGSGEAEQHAIDYPFSVFKMQRSSSHEDMKAAYKKAILSTHPDKTDYDSDDDFIEVQTAWDRYLAIV